MELVVDKSHKKIDLSKLKKPLKKFTIGSLIALSLYSGAVPTTVYAQETEQTTITQDSTIVEIPEDFKYDISYKVGKEKNDNITAEDLKQIEYLYIAIDNPDSDLSFLKYCTNLKDLSITCNCDGLEYLKTLPKMDNLESLDLYNLWYDVELNKDNMGFISNVKSLKIAGITAGVGVEEELNKLDEFGINTRDTLDIDFNKLTGIKKLDLTYTEPYDIAIFLNSNEYNNLINNGVEIVFKNDEAKNKYLETSKKLDEIVASLNISENATDKEKLDAILVYVLEHFEYDSKVSELIDNGEDRTRERENYIETFYEDGRLYGAIEKDTQICGNYAAMVEALSDRLQIPTASTYVTSNNHAWNVVNVDGELYYVDATWLDGLIINEGVQKESIFIDEDGLEWTSIEYEFVPQSASKYIKEGDTDRLEWYMEDISDENISKIDQKNSHVLEHKIPSYMYQGLKEKEQTVQVEQEENTELDEMFVTTESKEEKETEQTTEQEVINVDSNKKIKLKIGKKEIIITVGALIGILAATGGAIAIKNKKEQERRRRLRQQQMNMYGYGSYNDPFGSPFNTSYDDPFNNPYNTPNKRRR